MLAIIGLIVGMVGPRLFNQLSGARVKTARLQMEQLAAALDIFYLDVGRYPTAAEGLGALVRRPADTAGWNGPYIKGNEAPKDPWSAAYLYRAPGQSAPYELVTFGADRKEGGEGDAADILVAGQR